MNTVSARLVILSGSAAGQIVKLGGQPITIGREPSNQIVLSEPEISRRHLRIIPQGDGYVLQDLESANGTFLNGKQALQSVQLQDQDEILIGEDVKIVFEMGIGGGMGETIVMDAGIQSPPMARPAATAPLGEPAEQPPVGAPSRNRWAWGCVAALLLAACLCGSLLFYLDANNPELLYGPLQPIFDLIRP